MASYPQLNLNDHRIRPVGNTLKKLFIVSSVIIGISAVPAPVRAFDRNGFHLSVARDASLSDLHFSWNVSPPFNYDAFKVRVHISDGREGQIELPGRTRGVYLERNAGVGLTYTSVYKAATKVPLARSVPSGLRFSLETSLETMS
jgi:hypothetical protein